ncbi:Fc.00g069090.m01.CDS01 [Cosmosporella sp. VM-42]
MATTDQYRQHALPPTPHQIQIQQRQQYQQEQYYPPAPQQNRPQPPANAKSRTFSFHSQKSHKSSGSKDFLHESSAEKEAKRLHSKADPTLAISEAEPSAVAAMMTQSSIAPLRSIQHKDTFGNAIADPDKSNPTRNRWERPLDTIRSFEAAIDGGYSQTDTASVAGFSKRNSVYTPQQPRFANDSYYNNRPISFRPESYRPESYRYDRPEKPHFDPGQPRQSYFDGQAYNNGYGAGPSRMRTSRLQTEPAYTTQGRDQNIYPLPHKDRSYETVTSAAASGNSDQNGYQTDPTSSDNSSIDRTSPAKRLEPVNDYGIGFSQPQSYQPQILAPGVGANRKPVPLGAPQQQAPTAQHLAPSEQQNKRHTLLRRPSTQKSTQESNLQRPEPEKRKSWLARRFSKRS